MNTLSSQIKEKYNITLSNTTNLGQLLEKIKNDPNVVPNGSNSVMVAIHKLGEILKKGDDKELKKILHDIRNSVGLIPKAADYIDEIILNIFPQSSGIYQYASFNLAYPYYHYGPFGYLYI